MPYCAACGAEVDEANAFCTSCGHPRSPTPTPPPPPPPAPPPTPVSTPEDARRHEVTAAAALNTSGGGSAVEVPIEVKEWSWGAFLLSWIWGLGNRTYIALLALLPVGSFVMPFVLGAKANEWAWQNKRWESVEAFKRTQRKWRNAGIIVVSSALGLAVLAVVAAALVAINGTARDATSVPFAPSSLTQTLTSSDGRFTIRVPEDWSGSRQSGVNIAASSPSGDEYIFVITNPRPKGLDESQFDFDSVPGGFVKGANIENATISEPRETQIDGHKAVQHEIRGTVQGNDLIYLHTVLLSPTSLVQVVSWTSADAFAHASDQLYGVTATFDEA